MKLLLVNTNQSQNSALASELTPHGYQVTIALDSKMGLGLADTDCYDLVLFEASNSSLEGLWFCQTLRSQACQVPILFITEHDSSELHIASLNAGADDYLVAPFNVTELLLRIQSLLRRGGLNLLRLTWGIVQLNTVTSKVYIADQCVPLTPEELRMLELFLRNPRCVFSHQAIADDVWGEGVLGDARVSEYIDKLRKKLGAVNENADPIEQVCEDGYRLRTLSEDSLTWLATRCNLDDSKQIDTMLTGFWERFKPSFLLQLKTLEQATDAAYSQGLDSELREKAIQDAHRLAGALGIFGYSTGSPMAKEVERLLRQSIKPNSDEAEMLKHLVRSLNYLLQHPPDFAEVDRAIAPSPPAVSD
jgi:DNA-binding response OmpR family regulator/HPt (histidine-containing phosphotransfer) domain-containing protein